MSLADNLSIDPGSHRAKILRNSDPENFRWAVPIMRVGYAGRALVYLVVAGVSLWSIYQGGQAEGTSGVLSQLTRDAPFVVVLVAVGMFAYAIWRLIDCFWDLEAYGLSGKGFVARAGMLVTGTIHAGIGVIALSALGWAGGSGSGQSRETWLTQALSSPTGKWLVGIAGVLTLCAAVYYAHKAISEKYRENLKANRFTTQWNTALKLGVLAQAVVVAIIGFLIVYAAVYAQPNEAGGLGAAFEWLRSQPYGQILVILLCVGLLGFALFCGLNSVYRIVPRAADPDVENLSSYFNRQ